MQTDVSIHAPWEGCDSQGDEGQHGNNGFQFTHPGKGATLGLRVGAHLEVVSIHAPWEGCDDLELIPFVPHWMFQFTHPGKGATIV